VATETTTIKVVADTRDAERAIGGLTSALAALGGITFAGGLASQFITLANSAAEMTNKLIFATGGIANANAALDILGASAARTGSDLGGTVDLFQKLAQSSTFAGSSTESLAYITEQFNKTLQISGASGAGAASALYQFAQAMQKGTLNGDEMRTIMETNGYLMKVLEEQTGKTRVELIQMASQGQLSAEIIGRALIDSNSIAQDYGNTVRTLPQAFANFNTSLTLAVKKLDDKLKITQLLSKGLMFLSDNIGVAIGALAGLAVAIVGITVALIPAATAMAILTGGVALLAAAGVGAAIGLAVQEANKLTAATENTVKTQTQLATQAKEGLKVTAQRTTQELDLDKTLGEQITKLKQSNQYLKQEGPLKDRNLEVGKAIGAEQAKYLALGKQIPAGLESQLRAQLMIKAVEEDRISTAKTLLGLSQSQVMATKTDAFERAVLGKMQSYQNSVSKQEYEAKKATVEQAVKQTQIAEYNNQLAQDGIANQQKILQYGITDAAQRANLAALDAARNKYGQDFVNQNSQTIVLQATQLRIAEQTNKLKQELADRERVIQAAMGATTEEAKIQEQIQIRINQLGSDFTVEQQKQYENDLRAIAALEKKRDISQAIADMKAPPTTQAVIGAAQSQFGTTDTGIDKQRQTQEEGLQLLRDRGLISEQEYQNRLLLIQQTAGQQRLTQQQAEAEAILRAAGVTNQAVIDMTKKQMQNVAMIRQGGIVGAQGMLTATADIFQQMGTYNKDAFNTYKALAIAQAMISTYQAAAMAVSFPPGPPISFFYVAGAIAAGLAQVNAIRSQQFSGRALGGPVMGGKPYMVGENGPELFTPANSGSITRNDQLPGGGTTNVTFNINANDTAGFDQLLTSRRGLITTIIADAQLERGRRA
jgi:tape measure domain-containing protein